MHSIERPNLAYGPISENRFAVDIFFGNQSPDTAVAGILPVVTHDEVVTDVDGAGIHVSLVHVFLLDVRFFQRFSIDEDDALADLNSVARQANDSLDERFCVIAWIPENNDVPA